MILAGAGVVVVLAIYLWSRGRKGARSTRQFDEELPPGALEDMEGLTRQIVEPDDAALAREAAALGAEMADHYNGDHPTPEAMPSDGTAETYVYTPPQPREEAPPPPRFAATSEPVHDPVHEPEYEPLHQAQPQWEPEPEREPEPAPPPPKAVKKAIPEILPEEDDEEEEYQGEEKIIALHITAPKEVVFTGSGVLRAVQENGMAYGELEIFHRPAEKGRRPVFSLANMVKPGTFDPDEMEAFTTPGITLFLRLPNPMGGIAAFDEMYDAANRIAGILHGEIRDQSRNLMSRQGAEHLREQIREFTRKQRLAQVGSSFSGRK